MAAGLKLASLTPLTLTSATRAACSSTTLSVYSAIVTAEAGNTGNIYVGGADVSISNGIPVEPGNALTLAISGNERFSEFDLADVYIITSTTNNIARINCFRRKL